MKLSKLAQGGFTSPFFYIILNSIKETYVLFIKEVDDLLLSPEGRKTIGYNYLVSENRAVEIAYDKEGKNYNVSYGPNRAQMRANK